MTLFKISSWLFVAAAFSLISSNLKIAKPFDVLILLTGLFVVFQKPAWATIVKMWPKIRIYFFYILLIVAFVAVGQVNSHYNHNTPTDEYFFLHYARVIFNAGVLLFTAFLIYFLREQKILWRISLAIFLSPAMVAPVFLYEKLAPYYLDGGRLKGLLITAIIFGAWMMISFLLGVGFFAATSKLWKKTLIVSWMGIIAGMMLWSGSRAAWLGTLLGIAIWAAIYLFNKKDGKAATAIVAATATAFILGYLTLPAAAPETQEFIETRIVTLAKNPLAAQEHTIFWRMTSEFSLKNPLGLGYGRFNISTSTVLDVNKTDEFTVPRSTNTFFEIWIAGGAGAGVAALLIALTLLFGAYSAIKSRSVDNLSLAWLVILPAFLFAIFFTDAFLHRHIWFILGVVLGTVLITSSSSETDAPQPKSAKRLT